MKEYEQIRAKLLAMQQEINARLEKITEHVKHPDEPIPKDFSEQATEAENDQVLDALGNAARQEAAQIQQALARIASGDYGSCVECGAEIRLERLEALPFTVKCIDCAVKGEHKSQR